MPTTVEAFMRLVETGWDAEVARRPHSHHTTVVCHLDIKEQAAALHLGPLLTESDRRYLLCDATCEVWFEGDGQVIGAGRATRLISRRLRRALEHRHRTCAVLALAWTRVRENTGARSAGIDQCTARGIEASADGVAGFLEQLREALRSGTFRPVPVRRVEIPKASGKVRKLGIPTVADRVCRRR